MASETESVTQRRVDIPFLGFAEGEIDAIVDVLVLIVRVMVDGWRNNAFFQRHDTCQRFHCSGSTDQMTGHRLGRIQIHLIHMLSEHTLNRFQLRHIAQWSRGSVCIDEVYLLRRDTGVLQRQAHHALCTLAFRIRCGHMVRIRRHAFSDNLGVNLRTTCFGMLVLFQY